MQICQEILQKVLLLSKESEGSETKELEEKPSEKKEQSEDTPTEQDHYVYESIIAEVGYQNLEPTVNWYIVKRGVLFEPRLTTFTPTPAFKKS